MNFLDQTIEITFEKVMLGQSADSLVKDAVPELEVTLQGVVGDRHYGIERKSGGREKKLYPSGTQIRNNRQWSAVSAEELQRIADELNIPELKPEWLGANFLISGIRDLTHIPSMSHIILNQGTTRQVVLLVYNQNGPCRFPGAIIAKEYDKPELEKQFPLAAHDCRGIVGWVEHGGRIRQGDRGVIRFPEFIDPAIVKDLS